MTARCTSCGESLFFRPYRGAKLSDQSCKCGGKYELVTTAPNMRAEGLNLPDGIVPYNAAGNLWIYPMKNSKGQLFLRDFNTNKFKPFTP